MELIIDQVSKQFKDQVWGLQEISLKLKPGVLGLLGPNGAGKSTLMRILATITKPTSGVISWKGTDIVKHPDAVRAELGYLPQDFGVYPNLNAVEFLEYMAAIKGLAPKSSRKRIHELIELVNLMGVHKRPLGSFSGGQKQRVGIAQALLNDPRLLIVDEPTTGLDPDERLRFRNLLSDLSGERIVILSTHIVPDVEAVATEIAIIKQGRLLSLSAPEELLAYLEGKVWEWVIPASDLMEAKQKYLITDTSRRSDGIHVRLISDESPGISAAGTAPKLEDAFIYYTRSREGAAV